MDLAPFLTFGFAMAALAGFVSGVVRGFTCFGANLVWAPVLVTVMDPIQALAIMGMVGLAGTVQIAIPVAKVADWNGLYPIILSSWVAAPLGLWALYHMDATNVRRAIGVFVLIIAAILISGWRYQGEHTGVKGRLAQIGTGGIGGWLSGFAGIGGPIPVLYFMAGNDPAPVQRANNVISVGALIPVALAILIFRGEVTATTLLQSAILFFPVTAGLWLGAHSFSKVPAKLFRNAVLVLLILIGISALSF